MRTIDEWNGCYPSQWKGVIVPESMSHPAKYSSKLIRRIYEHMFQEGWVHEGDRVLDPFGGVALGALDAMRLGLNWTGIELEAKFHGLGNQNIEKWIAQFGNMPHWGSARLLNGDSRKLIEIIAGSYASSVSSPPYADGSQHTGGDDLHPERMQGGEYFGVGMSAALSSPPYSEARIGQESGQEHCGHGDQYGGTDGQLGSMKAEGFEASLSSPPYAETDLNYKRNGLNYERPYMDGQDGVHNYGVESGQLGAMKAGGFDAALSSPPYNPPMSQEHNGSRGGVRGTTPSEPGAFVKYGNTEGQLEGMSMDGFQAAISSPPFLQSEGGTPEPKPGGVIDNALYARHAAGNKSADGYGSSEGQLSSMKDGSFGAAVSSPPFEKTEGAVSARKFKDPEKMAEDISRKYESGEFKGHFASKEAILRNLNAANEQTYGSSEGQLGNDSGDDFWLAARTIVEQVYLSLAPGGHACWVLKDYVKNKSVVPFCDQWRQLCEAVGFTTLHEHHATLVHHKGKQHTLDGGMVEKKTESKSFFRRLAEKNGSPRIDYEVVLCMVKHA